MPHEKIGPALTTEEWRRARQEAFDLGATPLRDFAQGVAVANAGLPDSDTRKITRKKIASVRQAAHFLEESDGKLSTAWGQGDNPWHKLAADLRADAEALESYLPPNDG